MAAEKQDVVIYEDEFAKELHPLTYLRPAFQILSGCTNLVERVSRLMPRARINLIARSQFAEMLRQSYPGCGVNEQPQEGCLLLNGRCLDLPEAVVATEWSKAFTHGKNVIALRVDKKVPFDSRTGIIASGAIESIARDMAREEIEVAVLVHPWDLIARNPELLVRDFTAFGGKVMGVIDALAAIHGDTGLLSLGSGSTVEPFCVLDMRQGPVVIGNEVLIGSHSVIQGPCYIGGKSRVESALIRPGTTLGPGCRVSGEIESSVFQGWSNKQHNGFIGHSWVGEWVNLGAGTNASDLKNNYGQVRFGAESSAVDTGMLKLGCFIGDHAKTGIGCLLSAGAVIGPFSQLLGGAISPKYIPPFSWQAPDGFKTHRLEDALETAKAVMSRRSKELGETYEKMVRDLFQQVRRSGE